MYLYVVNAQMNIKYYGASLNEKLKLYFTQPHYSPSRFHIYLIYA